MKNYQITILNKTSNQKIAEYTIEEENRLIARHIAIGRFRREYKDMKDVIIDTHAKETNRKLITIQSPTKWEFV